MTGSGIRRGLVELPVKVEFWHSISVPRTAGIGARGSLTDNRGWSACPPPPRPFATIVVNASLRIMTNYGLSSILCPHVAPLRICRRRHEAANLSREQPREFDRRRVFALRPDDLHGDR
jgi:hypothetical protein